MRLQDLIAHHKQRLDLSYPEIAARATAAGYTMSWQSVRHYATDWDGVNVPKTATIRGLAAGLEVDPRTVLEAAAESADIYLEDVDVDGSGSTIMAMLGPRSPEQRAAAVDFMRQLFATIDAADTGRREGTT